MSVGAAIAQLYEAFANVDAPRFLNVCTHCCMTLAMESEICATPRKLLTAKHLYEYNSAAVGANPLGVANEAVYFAPRMLELIANGAEIHHSAEIALQRLNPDFPLASAPSLVP
jgi:hypothetical protein